MLGGFFLCQWNLFSTELAGFGTAGTECAAAGWIKWGGQITAQMIPVLGPFDLRIWNGDSADQCSGIGVTRVLVQAVPVRDFHYLSQVHDHDAMADLFDHA